MVIGVAASWHDPSHKLDRRKPTVMFVVPALAGIGPAEFRLKPILRTNLLRQGRPKLITENDMPFINQKCVYKILVCLLLTFGITAQANAQRKLDKKFKPLRLKMVQEAVIAAGIKNEDVIKSIQNTQRHLFMPKRVRDQAYRDAGIAIGESQTISSPFIVAYMTESLLPKPTDRVLEIGTGSGYQAAVLSPLVKDVYSIEIVETLGKRAAKVLKDLDYKNVHTKIGDGYKGWPDKAPFDKIIVTCSPENIPVPLVEQLREGGLMVVPMGERHQQTLYLMRKKNGEMVRESLRPTLFVPMTGAAEDQRKVLPDPTKPELLNGSFEEGLDKEGFVKGWYYQRQLKWKEDALAPNGQHFVRFNNKVSGAHSHLMQGFAIDGRKVPKLKLSASVAYKNVIKGSHRNDLPCVALMFFDGDRKELTSHVIGTFQGSSTWRNHDLEVRVPIAAREAIVRIGLFGAIGSASFDNLIIKPIK